MIEAEHSNADPAPTREDAVAEARGDEQAKVKSKGDLEPPPCSPAEAEANAKEAAQRAS